MKTKITERKLGKERASGIAYNDKKKDGKKFGSIEIDPRLEMHGGSNFDYMDTVIHEAIHIIDPILHEDDVKDMATKLTSILWKHGFRRVYL